MNDLSFEDFYSYYEFNDQYTFHNKKEIISVKKCYRQSPGKKAANFDLASDQLEIDEIIARFNDKKFIYKIIYTFDNEEYQVISSKEFTPQVQRRHPKLDPLIARLIGDYFCAICRHRDNYLFLNKVTGWKKNDYPKQISYHLKQETEETPIIFQIANRSNSETQPEHMKSLLDYLEQSDSLTTIFSYGILSTSLNNINHYTKRNDDIMMWLKESNDQELELFKIITPFSLCIYGDNFNKMTRKKIASIFLDYTKSTVDYPNRVCTHLPHSTLGTFMDKLSGICKYGDCPIIFSPSANVDRIVSTSRQVKSIEGLRQKGYIQGFPVFLSKSAIRRDKVLNVNISTVPYVDLSFGKIIESIIYSYILFWEKILLKKKDDWTTSDIAPYGLNEIIPVMTDIPFERYSKIFYVDEFNEDLAKCCRDLITALSTFAVYVEVNYSPSLHQQMQSILGNQLTFLENLARDCECQPQTTPLAISQNEENVKKEFFNIIIRIVKESPKSVTETENEIYVDYITFQKYYAKKNYKAFLAKCRPFINSPQRPNTGQYRGFAFSKIINGKKTNVLVIPKEIFMPIYDQVCQ